MPRAFTVVLVLLLFSACAGNSENLVGSSGAPPSPVPSPSSNTGSIATPLPTLPGTVPSLAACPLDHAAICILAIEFQNALNAGDVEPIVATTEARSRLCQDSAWALDDDIGCPEPIVEGDMSDPVVFLLFSGGDCCAMTPAHFSDELRRWLAETDGAPRWRVFAATTGDPLWDGDPAIMIADGAAPESRFIEIAISPNAEPRVHGVVVGTFLTGPYVSPQERLVPWP